ATSIPHAIHTLKGAFILGVHPYTTNILGPGFLPKMIIDKKTFAITGKTFMNSEVGHICIGDIVGKPFMTRFMDDDKIKFQPPSRVTYVPSPVSILKSVSISDDALVLHSEVRCFYKFVSIFVERIWPKPIFECFQHHSNLRKLLFSFIEIIGKDVIITIQ